LAEPGAISRAVLADEVREAIGSVDWRWLHVRESFTPLDYNAGTGLIGALSEPSLSAHALAKCQSVWSFWDRARGLEVTGESNCKDFLASYRENLLAELTARIRIMDRQELVMVCGRQYQAARAEQDQWRTYAPDATEIRQTTASESHYRRPRVRLAAATSVWTC
jgi:hypothetical protein